MLAIIVVLASVLGSRSGQTKVTLHSDAIEAATVTNNTTTVDLSKYDKGLQLDFTSTSMLLDKPDTYLISPFYVPF